MTTENGITNIDIEKFFENETNDDLKKKLYGCLFVRFVITKYINFYKIIKEKEQNIHLLFSTLAEKINQERVGGAFLISIQKKTFLLFDSFDFVGFKQFIIDNDSAIIDNMYLI